MENIESALEILREKEERENIRQVVENEANRYRLYNLKQGSIVFIYALWKGEKRFILSRDRGNLNEDEILDFYTEAEKSYETVPEFRAIYDCIKNIFRQIE